MLRSLLAVVFCWVVCSDAQTVPPPVKQQTVVVTGTAEPVPLEESDRSVNVYSLRHSSLLFGSLTDAMSLDSSVQVQARAPGGVQGDLSIRGGGFAQNLILIDGIRLSDAQSAHHALDLPIPLDAVNRIEILRGSGSTLYGSEAVAGVVNVVTADAPERLEMRLRAGYGTFSTNEQSGFVAFRQGLLSQQFSFERELSTGFRDDRDYRNLALASESWLRTRLGLTRVFLSLLDRPFGADQFYGNFNSWERTKTWLAALSQDLGKNTIFSLGYRRHTDLYVLFRNNPAYYTNHHEDETWDAALRRHDFLRPSSSRQSIGVFYGAELLSDHVESNNLGVHSRKQAAVYGSLDVRFWRRFSFSAGDRLQFYGNAGAIRAISVPSVSGGFWLSSKAKLRGTVNRSFRLPNYTDLYYHDPANIGNPNLRPEHAMNYEGGLDFYPAERWRSAITVFSRHETDDIDYVRANSSAIWQALNFGRVTLTGVEASIGWQARNGQKVDVQYTALHGAQAALNGFQSKYVFNYPTQQAVMAWQSSGAHGWIARLRAGVTEQYQRDTYFLLDAYAAWIRSPLHPYLRLTNLTNANYQPVYGVVMPGRAALAGLEWCVFCGRN